MIKVVNFKTIRTIAHIFVTFSGKLNFNPLLYKDDFLLTKLSIMFISEQAKINDLHNIVNEKRDKSRLFH